MSQSLSVSPGRPLRGRLKVPGDKSVSHRSLIFNGVAQGRAKVTGILDAGDVRSTRKCMEALGVPISGDMSGELVVQGRSGELLEPFEVLDCGNSGTSMRLLCGLLAGQDLYAVLTGDQHLRRRPMRRVTGPLSALGARFDGRQGGDRAPLSVRGGNLRVGPMESQIASAQVKTAMMLASLGATGTLDYREPSLSRDHSERLFKAMGAELEMDGKGHLVLPGGQSLQAVDVQVPGDISSAAFFLVAAAITPGSDLVLEGVGLNPTRAGIVDALQAMGADLEVLDLRESGGEPIGDLRIRHAHLQGTTVSGDLIPRLIDEVPVLAIAAAFAEGETVISDAHELRVKESDRIAATAAGLRACGGQVEETPDGMIIQGGRLSGGQVTSFGDHRIAMSFCVAGCAADGEVHVSDTENVSTSFPTFPKLLEHARVRV
ncbi:MAG: 3-phosphoshikimate 1-carboxyvinyltransferase [Myxococcota bacterium]|nr:3-phosphoshikimate 1-carboxyvinyltransferase [Myxococcota bacterium]